MNVQCPQCGSKDLEDMDESTVYPEEVKQEFICNRCLAVLCVTYTPIAVTLIEEGEDVDPT